MTLGVAKPPTPPTARELAHATLRRDYEDYLRRQRGLSERTIGHCWRFADRFLSFRFGEADVEFSAITPGNTVAFLQRLTTRKPPFRDKTPPTHLRSFFQYLFKSGLTVTNLALCVPSISPGPGPGPRNDQADDLPRPRQSGEHVLVHRGDTRTPGTCFPADHRTFGRGGSPCAVPGGRGGGDRSTRDQGRDRRSQQAGASQALSRLRTC